MTAVPCASRRFGHISMHMPKLISMHMSMHMSKHMSMHMSMHMSTQMSTHMSRVGRSGYRSLWIFIDIHPYLCICMNGLLVLDDGAVRAVSRQV